MYEYFGWCTNLLSIICCEEKALLCRMYLLLTNFHVGYDITMLYILYFMCRILVKKVLFCKIMAYLLQKHFLVDTWIPPSCNIFRALKIMSVNSLMYAIINNISFFIECFERIRTGYKHFTYRNSMSATTVRGCAEECFRNTKGNTNCQTFSFRHR